MIKSEDGFCLVSKKGSVCVWGRIIGQRFVINKRKKSVYQLHYMYQATERKNSFDVVSRENWHLVIFCTYYAKVD